MFLFLLAISLFQGYFDKIAMIRNFLISLSVLFFITNSVISKESEEEIWRSTLSEEKSEELLRFQEAPSAIETYLANVISFEYYEYRLVQVLAGSKMHENQFEEAINVWEKYKEFFPTKKNEISELIEIIKNDQDEILIRNLGSSINTEYAEYLPILEMSGKRIFFTSFERNGNKTSEDIYYSDWDESKKEWSLAKSLSDLNTELPEAAISLSVDGSSLILFGNQSESLGQGDIFYSELSKEGWDKAKAFPQPINSEYFEADLVYTPNRKAVLFSSDRPNDLFKLRPKDQFSLGDKWGNTDIYVSFLNENGEYMEPINLGSTINTAFAERTPYLHSDGKTLYFSSNGHNGFGDLDIFKSVRLDDTWTKWSKPVNIGKYLNGSGTDWGFKLNISGRKGYLSAARLDSFGDTDLYEVIPLPKRAEPLEFSFVLKGKVVDEEGNFLNASIKWYLEETKEEQGFSRAKSTNGDYIVNLETGKKYLVNFYLSGFQSQTIKVDTAGITKFQDIIKQIVMKKGDSVSVESPKKINQKQYFPEIIYFNPKSHQMNPAYLDNLQRVVTFLQNNPSKNLLIKGYAKDGGSEIDDINLSSKRAENIQKYFLVQGIPSKRMIFYGLGRSRPDGQLIENKRAIKYHHKVTLEIQ